MELQACGVELVLEGYCMLSGMSGIQLTEELFRLPSGTGEALS